MWGSFRYWSTSETKRRNLGPILHPTSLTFPSLTTLPTCSPTTLQPLQPCHLIIVPPFLHDHLTTLPSFPPSQLTTLPPFPPPQLTTLPPFQLTTLPTINRSLRNNNVLPLSRQGKHVWLIIWQLLMKAGWWEVPLALQDLAKAISSTYEYIF